MLKLNEDYLQPTPVQYMKNNVKLSSRKLWDKINVKMEFHGESFNKHRASDKDDNKWDTIESPQFVDFSNSPEKGSSFFSRSGLIASTPLPVDGQDTKLTISDSESTLIASCRSLGLSPVIRESPIITYQNIKDHQKNGVQEKCEAKNTQIVSKTKLEIWDKNKKPQSTAVYPFTFDLRGKDKKEDNQQKTKMVSENEKDNKVFRANPLPKYLKSRIAKKTDNNENLINNPNEKAKETDSKVIKKNIEPWKKPPFTLCLTKKNVDCSKPPFLQTAVRAEKRKCFDMAIQEKEQRRKQMRQMENAIKKKQEEDAIAELRKQTVFKARPVPKYKPMLPKVEKRPLTDPTSPKTLKRRRKLTQSQN